MFPAPKSQPKKKNIIQVSVSPNVAFAYNLRKQRILNNLTQKQVTAKLGFKNLYSYQRLENPKTTNPALSTIFKIKKIFPEFKVDEVFDYFG